MSAKKEDITLITKKGVRHDGRKSDDLRNISFKVGILDRADGSALIQWGRNKILAAVYGPRELHPKHLAMPDRALIRCEYRMATFSVPDRKSPAPKRREREISKVLSEALEPAVFAYLYPRSVIDVFIEVIQADGGTRCASVTAAALALADSGIPMRDLVVGCAAGVLGEQVVLDLDDVEDKDGRGDLPIAYLPNMDKIVLLQSDGLFTIPQYKEALDLLKKGCLDIYKLQRDALTSKFARISAEVSEELDDDDTKEADKKKDDDKKKEADKKKDDDKKKDEDKKKDDEKKDDDKKKKSSTKSSKKSEAKTKSSSKKSKSSKTGDKKSSDKEKKK
jgi:exosome complex component RRP41